MMDAKTLDALKASIRKWDKNTNAMTTDQFILGVISCPLCEIFNTPGMDEESECVGCPVFALSGKRFCAETPYVDASRAAASWEVYGIEYRGKAHAAARVEADFLRSLLSEGESA